EGVTGLNLEASRITLGQLNEASMIDRIRATLHKANAAKSPIGSLRSGAAGSPEYSHWTAVIIAGIDRLVWELVDVANAGQIGASNPKIADGQSVVLRQGGFEIETPLMRAGRFKVRLHHVNIGRGASGRREVGQYRRV